MQPCKHTSIRKLLIIILFVIISTIGFAMKTSATVDELTSKIDLTDINPPFSFYRFCKLSTGELWTVGGRGQVIYTQVHSSMTYRITEFDLFGIFFTNSRQGWVVGSMGTIFSTLNAGQTWKKQYSGVQNDLEAIKCSSKYFCLAVGGRGTVLRTNNAGDTWEKIDLGILDNILAIDLIDERHWWIVGSNGLLLSTVDGGINWARRVLSIKTDVRDPKIAHPTLFAVKFLSEDMGWVAGTQGIFQTKDGGVIWQHSLKNQQIVGLVINEANSIWAIGTNGKNYFTDDMGTTWRRPIVKSK